MRVSHETCKKHLSTKETAIPIMLILGNEGYRIKSKLLKYPDTNEEKTLKGT
jgi:hypothetical protein